MFSIAWKSFKRLALRETLAELLGRFNRSTEYFTDSSLSLLCQWLHFRSKEFTTPTRNCTRQKSRSFHTISINEENVVRFNAPQFLRVKLTQIIDSLLPNIRLFTRSSLIEILLIVWNKLLINIAYINSYKNPYIKCIVYIR